MFDEPGAWMGLPMRGDRVGSETERRRCCEDTEPNLNGSELSSQAMDLWAYQHGVHMAFSRPRKPTDNAFVESFNGTFRTNAWMPIGSLR
jgi:hypothetical protein